MAAYCLFDNVEVIDPVNLREYAQRVAPIVDQDGGRYVVVGGRVDLVEGDWRPAYPVLLEFPSREQAHCWYNSDECRDLKALQLSAVRSNAVICEGLRDPAWQSSPRTG